MNILDDPNNKLNPQERKFFMEMTNYIELPLYFIGSITRYDYFPGNSDIDLEVYSENEISTLFKILHFLNIDKKSVKLIYFTCHKIPMLGYKISYNKYLNGNKNTHFDITIYTMASKQILLPHRIRDINIPIYNEVYLLIIKYIYYHGKMINNKTYSYLKRLNVVHVNPDKSTSMSITYDDYIQKYMNDADKYNKYFVKLYK